MGAYVASRAAIGKKCAALGSALFRAAESGGGTFQQAYGYAFGGLAAGAAVFLVLTLPRPRVWFGGQ